MSDGWPPEGRGAKGLPFRLCEKGNCHGKPVMYVNGKYLCEMHGEDAKALTWQMELREMVERETPWLREKGFLVVGGQVVKKKKEEES